MAPAASLLAPAGYVATGHEFHRTTVAPALDQEHPGWLLDGTPAGFSLDPAGRGERTLHASYLHTHWAGHPLLAARFAAAVHRAATAGLASDEPPARLPRSRNWAREPRRPLTEHDVDLHHHGDAEIAEPPGRLRRQRPLAGPPAWLAEAIEATTRSLGSYPRPAAAIAAVARRHQRPVDQVLLTAGGAEAFTLLARALRPRHAVVVHPQFTEPEAALRTAGHRVDRVLLDPADGFALHPERIPDGADLVVIGNPTNPTGTLHPAALLRGLVRPGRVVVVDEAFIDAVPGEAESLAATPIPGLLVIRSLTKTWGIAGLRAGYLLAPADLVGDLAAQQPPWSVSSPALAAIEACSSDRARAEAEAATATIRAHRAVLVDGLAELGLPVAGHPLTPFVLVDTDAADPAGQPARVSAGCLAGERLRRPPGRHLPRPRPVLDPAGRARAGRHPPAAAGDRP